METPLEFRARMLWHSQKWAIWHPEWLSHPRGDCRTWPDPLFHYEEVG
jgi:hypothetical protein